jgi:hypothetical protein
VPDIRWVPGVLSTGPHLANSTSATPTCGKVVAGLQMPKDET